MRISEIITELEAIRTNQGDLEAFVPRVASHNGTPIIEEPQIKLEFERVNMPENIGKFPGRRQWRKYLDPEAQKGAEIVVIRIPFKKS